MMPRRGRLAIFEDQDQWKAGLKDLGDNPYDGFGYIWIGAERRDDEWVWMNGTKVDFNLWADGQPSNRTKATLAGRARGRTAGAWYANDSSTGQVVIF